MSSRRKSTTASARCCRRSPHLRHPTRAPKRLPWTARSVSLGADEAATRLKPGGSGGSRGAGFRARAGAGPVPRQDRKDRKSVGGGKSGEVRVALGVRRYIKKKNTQRTTKTT